MGLNFFTRERVADESQFKWQPVGVLGMFKLGSVFVINFNYLLNRITEQEVVVRLVLDLEVIGFEQKVLGGCAFYWSAFFAGYNRFGGWVNNLFEIWLVVGY